MTEEMIVCPICTEIIRSSNKNNKGTKFVCEKCKTVVFVRK